MLLFSLILVLRMNWRQVTKRLVVLLERRGGEEAEDLISTEQKEDKERREGKQE